MRKINFSFGLLYSLFLSPFFLFAANPGDVIITEIMQNPKEVTDTNGEWFEIYNTTVSDINLQNWTIKDNGTNEHVISSTLIIPARGFLVLGRNANSAENGSYSCDYQFESFFLSNSDDEIILLDENGSEIDRVEYDGGTIWPDPNGASMALINFTFDNNDGNNWTVSQARQGSYSDETGDFGSPGTLGVEQQLPVLLVDFSVKIVDNGILLKWQTGLEVNNLGFKIQRSLNSSENFETISNLIAGKGNSINPVNYVFVDQTAIWGNRYYYRIVDVSFDGVKKYHQSLAVNFAPNTIPDKFSFESIYPNPVLISNNSRNLNLQFNIPKLEKAEKLRITIFNLLGQKILEDTIELFPGSMICKKQLPPDLNAGRYFLHIKFRGQVYGKSLLVLN